MFTLTGTRLFFLHIGDSPKDHGSVMTCATDGSDLRTLVSGLGTHPDGIAVDTEKGHVYYTNMGADPSKNDGFISRVNIDGSNNTFVLAPGMTHTPKQCVIERKSRKLYWCDREGMKVWRMDLDGTNAEVLYVAAEGLDARKDERNHCVGIMVDIERGLIMWTQKGPPKGGQGRLFSAGIDILKGETASSRSDVKAVMRDLPEPIDLEADFDNRHLYKTDRGAEPRGNTVSRVHLDNNGEAVEEILVDHLHEAIGLALDLKERMMYFTDIGGSLYSANIDGSKKRVLLDSMGDLTGICCVHLP